MEKAKLPQSLSLKYKVELDNDKENPILNLRLTPTQSNFMYIYLSKIDARKPATKQVTFSLDEYANIMGLEGRISTTRILNVTKSLYSLSYPEYDEEAERIKLIHAFDNFEMYKEGGDWYVTISCHQKAEKRFFELSKYTAFEVWNVLALSNPTHRKLYEILKQQEKLKFRDLTLKELRKLLLLKENELAIWDNFKRMLNFAEKALRENTDIYFTWEVLSRRGKGGRVHSLRFHIFKNEEVLNRPRQMHIREIEEQFKREREIDEELHQEASQIQESLRAFQNAITVDYEIVDEWDEEVLEAKPEKDILAEISKVCEGSFTPEENEVLHKEAMRLYPEADTDAMIRHIGETYRYMRSMKNIDKPFRYVRHMLQYIKPSSGKNGANTNKYGSPTQDEIDRLERLLSKIKEE